MVHLNIHSLKMLRSIATGIDFVDKEVQSCVACLQRKHSRHPFKKSGTRARVVLELIHSDLCGPMENVSIGGSRYFITFIDDNSRKIFVYFLKSKNQVLQCFQDFKSMVENQTGKRIKRIRSDNGTEYVNGEMEKFLRKSGIHHEVTVPYNPEQNGLAERANRTIVERARCLLFDANLEKRFWAEAVSTAVFLINRSPTKGLRVTPEERFSGMRPDLSELRVFGAKVMCHVPKAKRLKWDPKSEPGIFVGYSDHSKALRVFNPRTGKVFVSRDVVFLNEAIGNATQRSEAVPVNEMTIELLSDEIVEDNEVTGSSTVLADSNNEKEENVSTEDDLEDETDYDSANDTIETIRVPSPALPSQQEEQRNVVRHSERERRIPGKYHNFDMTYSVLPEPFVESQVIDEHERATEPQSVGEAMGADDRELWREAMEAEMQALNTNKTWKLTELPAGRKALKCKWIFKRELNPDGSVEKYKARLVIKGFSQVKGVDYNETYSPVVRYASIRFLLALAAQQEMHIHQMDAVTAFLQGELSGEEIYMEQPEGFVDRKAPKKVCRLLKALYGLKQASRVWNTKLDAELKRMGLKRSRFDPCVYFKIEDNTILVIAVYVDDFLLFSTDQHWIDAVKKQLMAKFHMKDLGEAKQVLGMRITRSNDAVMLDQERYVDELLERFNMTNCNTVSTPMDPHQRLTKTGSTTAQQKQQMQKIPFRELVGGLQFLAHCTRPDIAYAVNVVSTFNNDPSEIHWIAAKRILRYLKGTKSKKLTFRKQSEPSFEGFSDADWGNDIETRRSVTGYTFQYGGGSVAWSCRRQPTVALSTTEAEYMALSGATQEAVWWRGFLSEMFQIDVTVPIQCDNQSAICLAEKEIGYSPRSKHIDLRHHFVREQLERRAISLHYVKSELQKADVLTKRIPVGSFLQAVKN